MMVKFLKGLGIFLAIILVFSYYGSYKGFGIIIGGTLLYLLGLMAYGYIKTRREYLRNPKESQLIGRMTCGMDHKGKETRRIIWNK